jgi:dolichyl-phosphate-mannose--protein O-mannosyl transferase
MGVRPGSAKSSLNSSALPRYYSDRCAETQLDSLTRVFAGVALLSRASNLKLGAAGQENAEKNRTLWLPSVEFVLSLAPLAQVPRVLFLYHYLTPLIFGVCVVVLGLDSIGWTRAGSLGAQRRSYYFAILLILLGFLAISPFSFSFVNAPEYQQMVFSVFPSWR